MKTLICKIAHLIQSESCGTILLKKKTTSTFTIDLMPNLAEFQLYRDMNKLLLPNTDGLQQIEDSEGYIKVYYLV